MTKLFLYGSLASRKPSWRRLGGLIAVLASLCILMYFLKETSTPPMMRHDRFDGIRGVRCLSYSRPTGQLLVGDREGRVSWFRVNDRSFVASEEVHGAQVVGLAACNTSGLSGSYISSGLDDRVLFHRSNGGQVLLDSRSASSIAVSDLDTYVACSGALGGPLAKVWRISDLHEICAVGLGERSWGNDHVAISPDERTLAVAGSDNRTVILWDIPGGSARRSREFTHIQALAFNKAGNMIYILDNNKDFFACNLNMETLYHLGIGWSLAFVATSDDRWLFAGGATNPIPHASGVLEVWDLDSKTRRRVYRIDEHPITSMIAVDERGVVTASFTGERGLIWWDLAETIGSKN